jgi:hypothetical protein
MSGQGATVQKEISSHLHDDAEPTGAERHGES